MNEFVKEGKQLVIKLADDLTSTRNVDFEKEVVKLIKEDSVSDITLDLAEVKMVDSFGIKGLFAIHQSLNGVGGHLKVVNVSNDIYGLFKYMRMDTHFEITEK